MIQFIPGMRFLWCNRAHQTSWMARFQRFWIVRYLSLFSRSNYGLYQASSCDFHRALCVRPSTCHEWACKYQSSIITRESDTHPLRVRATWNLSEGAWDACPPMRWMEQSFPWAYGRVFSRLHLACQCRFARMRFLSSRRASLAFGLSLSLKTLAGQSRCGMGHRRSTQDSTRWGERSL